MEYILWFDEIGASDVPRVGGKGANLGELSAADLLVPPGFCLTTFAYRDFIQSSSEDLEAEIQRTLEQTDMRDPSQVARASASIRQRLHGAPIPETMSQEILASYRKLSSLSLQEEGRKVPVAIRSSATAEDLPSASFAGQQDTFLNVLGEVDLLERVKDCWASLWTVRAMMYREKQRVDHQKVYLAVVVQVMVPAEISGVLFTANPITGDRNEAVLNAGWGLGEAIVSGMISPDTIVVRKEDGKILSREIGEKEITLRSLPNGGIEEIVTEEVQRRNAALSDPQIKALIEMGKMIEDHYGVPQDIEWGLLGENIYVLQSRPITTLAQVEAKVGADDEYNRTMFKEIFPDPLSPSFLSVIRILLKEMLDFTLKAWGFEPPKNREAVGVFYHQPYFNRAYLVDALKSLSAPVRERMVAQLINPFGRHEQVMRGEISPAFLGLIARMMRFMVSFPSQLPEIVAKYRHEVAEIETQSFHAETLSDGEIIDRLYTLVFDSANEFLNYDFLMIALIGITYQILGSLLERYYQEDTEILRAKLISGVTGNMTMETNIHLWELAQMARSSPDVRACIQETQDSMLIERLEQSVEGREFLFALNAFLKDYGHREIRLDILYPTWSEDPEPVFGFIRGYLDAEESQSPRQQEARLEEERREATEEVLSRIGSSFLGRIFVSPLFRWILGQAQVHTRERDTMHFELTRLFPPFRRMLFALGERWTARGVLHQVDDIFYLHLEELIALAKEPNVMHEIIVMRRAEFEASKARPWPDIISSEGEIYLTLEEVIEDTEDHLQGISGSPGLVTGVARVIRGPDEFDRLNEGDILVAPLTNPAWTPLFAIAAGVVTEVGGILSHGAIVAREFGIPAVMSVRGATKRVSEGQVITVNGDRGIVQLGNKDAA